MTLFFRKFGSGPPFVILHGLFGSGDNWQSQANELAEHYTVYLVDQRNHGRSPHSDVMTYEAMVGDLLDLAATENLRDITLLGHSMGAKSAMRFALEHTFLLDRLIVVDMAVRAYPPHHESVFKGLLHAQVETAGSRGEAEERLRQFIDDPATRQFLLKNLYRETTTRFGWRFNLPVLFAGMDEILTEVPIRNSADIPVLIIQGEKSDYIRPTDVPEMLKLFPRAEFRTIAGSGHWPHAEKPKEFMAVIKSWLNC